MLEWLMGGVGEVAEADDTSKDSFLAGGETTDWPGHRRQRQRRWVLHSRGRVCGAGVGAKQGWKSQSLCGQLSLSRHT